MAVIGAIVGEFISGTSGLGYLVLSADNYFNTPMAFTALLYLVVMSLALYGLVIWQRSPSFPGRAGKLLGETEGEDLINNSTVQNVQTVQPLR